MIWAILPLSALNLSASNDTLLALGKAPKSTIVVSVKVSIESPKKRACIPIAQSNKGWINGGYFVLNYKVFDFIKNGSTMFEREPMQKLVKKKQLIAYKHKDFWHCVDTIRDKNILEEMYKKKYFYENGVVILVAAFVLGVWKETIWRGVCELLLFMTDTHTGTAFYSKG